MSRGAAGCPDQPPVPVLLRGPVLKNGEGKALPGAPARSRRAAITGSTTRHGPTLTESTRRRAAEQHLSGGDQANPELWGAKLTSSAGF